MKTAQLQVPASLDQTLPTPGDPTYQMEALARTIHNTLIELNTENFEFSAAEASDFNTYGNDMKTFIDNMRDREDEILLSGFSSIIANLPDVIPLISAILSGGTAAIPSILLNALIGQLYRSRNSAITAKEGEVLSDLDTGGVEDGLSEIYQELQNIKTELDAFKRGLVIPANGDTEYFVDLFKAFGVTLDGLSMLRSVLETFNINLYNDDEGANWSVGPLPD
jgi:hypothetical protein